MIRRLLRASGPAETRVFLFIGLFGFALAAIYWLVSSELAGTILLAGFGLGAFVVGVRLRVERRPAGVEADADVPFADERGRLPGETLAPLALGLGIALAMTSVVFGPWLLVAGIVPIAWGAWTWLVGARDELAATVADEGRGPGDGRSGAGHENAGARVGSGVE